MIGVTPKRSGKNDVKYIAMEPTSLYTDFGDSMIREKSKSDMFVYTLKMVIHAEIEKMLVTKMMRNLL